MRRAIARGDVYQVNLVQHLAAEFTGDPAALAARLAALKPHNRGPIAATAGRSSPARPELFLARRGSRVWTCPIKGTRPAGAASELAGSAKDAAEHVMIVDLERNDLARVCVPGQRALARADGDAALAGVEHMVSTVEGTLRDGVGLAELLARDVPGRIDHRRTEDRGGRSDRRARAGRSWRLDGGLGARPGNGDFDLALTIRTFADRGGRIHLWVGGGVVWDSDPQAEIAESWMKADPLLLRRRSVRRAIGPSASERASVRCRAWSVATTRSGVQVRSDRVAASAMRVAAVTRRCYRAAGSSTPTSPCCVPTTRGSPAAAPRSRR